MKGGEKIDVERAIRLFERYNDWHAVTRMMPRRDGTLFRVQAICAAVWRKDKGWTRRRDSSKSQLHICARGSS